MEWDSKGGISAGHGAAAATSGGLPRVVLYWPREWYAAGQVLEVSIQKRLQRQVSRHRIRSFDSRCMLACMTQALQQGAFLNLKP